MSSVLHPVGPEPQERYWVRRVGLLAAILVALSIVIALVVNATSAGSAVQSGVPAAPVVPAAAPATKSPTPTPTPTPTTISASPSPSPSASPSASASRSASAKPTATLEPSPTPSPTTSSSSKKSDTGKKTSGDSSTKKAALAPCPTASLRATITGTPNPKVKTPVAFSLSLINGSKTSCVLTVFGGNATVTVVSGSDRIWSTSDCSTSVPQTVTTLKPEQAVSWKVTWNGLRSKAGCQNRPETPRPGYYWAIATFADLDPVRTRLILHA